MSKHAKRLLIAAVAGALSGAAANAADLYEPPIYEAPPPVYIEHEKPVSVGGWYLRGDIDYHKLGWRGGDYITYGLGVPTPGSDSFRTGSLRPAFSLGGGVGYQVNRYFRADLTADYFFKSRFRGTTGDPDCGVVCTDESAVSALLLMANAYAELGTYGRITPYIGAGIGGARVNWDALRNTPEGGRTVVHTGGASWRFAYALMAGASYCINKNLKFDLGYRYARIQGGRMFSYASNPGEIGAGPGYDRGFNVHEGRAGLRYQFGGGGNDCGHKKEVHIPYEPEPMMPIYK